MTPPFVTIIGGGMVGICTALSLAEAGIKTRLIERNEGFKGASYGNAGIVSPWSVVPQSTPGMWKNIPSWLLRADGPLFVRSGHLPKFIPWAFQFLKNSSIERTKEISNALEIMNNDNIQLYQKHLCGTGHENLIRESMYVYVYRNPETPSLNSLENQIRADKGAELEIISAAELQELEPALSHDFKAALLIKNQARALSPGKIQSVLLDKYLQAGGKVIQTEVDQIHPNEDQSWTIKTNNGVYLSDKIVVAAGAWSQVLLRSLKIKIPLEAERGYHIQAPTPDIQLQHSIMDTDYKAVASSMIDGLRVAGTAEYAGLQAPPNPKRIQMLKRVTKKMLPDINLKKAEEWMGSRPSLPDGLPIISEFSQHKGLYGAFGHAHFGLMMAPKTGNMIRDLIINTRNNIDYSPFSANRF